MLTQFGDRPVTWISWCSSQIIHDETPWLELFQDVIVYGVSWRVSFKQRPEYRWIVAEMAPSR